MTSPKSLSSDHDWAVAVHFCSVGGALSLPVAGLPRSAGSNGRQQSRDGCDTSAANRSARVRRPAGRERNGRLIVSAAGGTPATPRLFDGPWAEMSRFGGSIWQRAA